MSLDTTRKGRLCLGDKDSYSCDLSYSVKIRGMVSIMPGWPFFTGYQTATLFAQELTSELQYKAILDNYFDKYYSAKQIYDSLISDYNFTNNVMKGKMFVKLDPSIS